MSTPVSTGAAAPRGITGSRAEGLFTAQLAAITVMSEYEDGTLADGMRSIVDRFIAIARSRGLSAEAHIDEVVNLAVDRWVAARLGGRRDEEAISMATAASALAAYMLAQR